MQEAQGTRDGAQETENGEKRTTSRVMKNEHEVRSKGNFQGMVQSNQKKSMYEA